MEDYREKLEKLSEIRLVQLAEVYRKTIKGLQEHYNQAHLVAMNDIANYTKAELEKKTRELADIEAMLAERRNQNKGKQKE